MSINPPQLPIEGEDKQKKPSNLIGAAAFATSVVSVGTVVGARRLLFDLVQYRTSLPHADLSGGVGFALNFWPAAGGLVAMTFVGAGLALLATSLWIARIDRRPLFTFLHLGTGIILLPVLIYTIIGITRTIR